MSPESDLVGRHPGCREGSHVVGGSNRAANGDRYNTVCPGLVSLPFLERFRGMLLDGTKTLTSRTRRHGKPGDRFVAFGQLFEIHAVYEDVLDNVALQKYGLEGCRDPLEFMGVWNDIHPRRRFDPDQRVFVHAFRMVR